jgi:hypothetical protein
VAEDLEEHQQMLNQVDLVVEVENHQVLEEHQEPQVKVMLVDLVQVQRNQVVVVEPVELDRRQWLVDWD